MNEPTLAVLFVAFAALLVYVAHLDHQIRRIRTAMRAHAVELTKAADLIHKLVEIERAKERPEP